MTCSKVVTTFVKSNKDVDWRSRCYRFRYVITTTMGKINHSPADSKTGTIRMYINQADGKITEGLINRHPQANQWSTENLYRAL